MPLELKTDIHRHLLVGDMAVRPRHDGHGLPSALLNLSQASRREWQETAPARAAICLHRQNVVNLEEFAAILPQQPSTSSHDARLDRPVPVYCQLGEFKKDGLTSLIKKISRLQTPEESAAAFKKILEEAKLLPARDALLVLMAEALQHSRHYLGSLLINAPNIYIDLVESASRRKRHRVVAALLENLPHGVMINGETLRDKLLPLCDQDMTTSERISLAGAMPQRLTYRAALTSEFREVSTYLVEGAPQEERHMVVEALALNMPQGLNYFDFSCANLLPLCDQGMSTSARISLAKSLEQLIPHRTLMTAVFEELRASHNTKQPLSDVVLFAVTPRLRDLPEDETAGAWDFILEQVQSHATKEVLGQYLANAVTEMPFGMRGKRIQDLLGEKFSTPATIGSIGAAILSQAKFWLRQFDEDKIHLENIVTKRRGDADKFAWKHKITLEFWRKLDPGLSLSVEEQAVPGQDVPNLGHMDSCYRAMSQVGAQLKSFRLKIKGQAGETDGLAALALGVAGLNYTGPDVISDDEIRELVRQSLAALVREEPNLSAHQRDALVYSLTRVVLNRIPGELQVELGEAIHAATSKISMNLKNHALTDMLDDPFPFRRARPEDLFELVLRGSSDQAVKVSSVQGLRFLPEELRWEKFKLFIDRDKRPGPELAQAYAKAVMELPLAHRWAALSAVAAMVEGARHEPVVLSIMNGYIYGEKDAGLSREDRKKAFSLMMERLEVLYATPTIHKVALSNFAESVSKLLSCTFLSEAEVVQNWNRIFNCVHDHPSEDQLIQRLSNTVRLYKWSNGGEAGKILLNKMVDRIIEKELRGAAQYLVVTVYLRTPPIRPIELTQSQGGTLAKLAAVSSHLLTGRYGYSDDDFVPRLGLTARQLDQAHDEYARSKGWSTLS